ncbi:MAG: hypothetical protein GTN81_13320 [Proteobacteria bacterium]|nr:hypothetical protein [Pseudomonadota bacterium]
MPGIDHCCAPAQAADRFLASCGARFDITLDVVTVNYGYINCVAISHGRHGENQSEKKANADLQYSSSQE